MAAITEPSRASTAQHSTAQHSTAHTLELHLSLVPALRGLAAPLTPPLRQPPSRQQQPLPPPPQQQQLLLLLLDLWVAGWPGGWLSQEAHGRKLRPPTCTPCLALLTSGLGGAGTPGETDASSGWAKADGENPFARPDEPVSSLRVHAADRRPLLPHGAAARSAQCRCSCACSFARENRGSKAADSAQRLYL